MERAIRVVSVERGHDPRDFALVAFGGCGGLHACEMAQELGIRTVLVPEYAGALSALGMLMADHVRDYAAGVLNRPDLGARVRAPGTRRAEGVARRGTRPIGRCSLRGPELRADGSMACGRTPPQPFHREHQRVYGYANPDRAIEIVTIRVRARLRVAKPELARHPEKTASGETNAAPNLCGGRMAQDASLHARQFVE